MHILACDDGSGFDINSCVPGKGINNILTRVNELHGQVDWLMNNGCCIDYHLLAELGDAAQGLDRILLYEGSRGCWWGEKHHCTFCGLNAQSMKFRAKSPDQAAREMTALSSHDTTRFRLVDKST